MIFALSHALAAIPLGLAPVATSYDVIERHAAYTAERGLPAQPLACKPLVDEYVKVCLRLTEGRKRHFVTEEELKRMGLTLDSVLKELSSTASRKIAELSTIEVEGMTREGGPATHQRFLSEDGWAVALFLQPALVKQRLGPGPLLLAIPGERVSLAWVGGNGELDKVMAVGVAELFQAEPGGVTPMVFHYDGQSIRPWAVAKASEGTK